MRELNPSLQELRVDIDCMDGFCRDLLDKALSVSKVVRFVDLSEPNENDDDDDIMESAYSRGNNVGANKRKFENVHQDVPVKGQLPLTSKVAFLSVVKLEANENRARQQLDKSSMVGIFNFAGDVKCHRIAWKESMHHSFQMF